MRKPVKMLDSNYGARLLRQCVKEPELLLSNRKFLRPEFFLDYYLNRAEKLMWQAPSEALALLEPAADYAGKLAEEFPAENGADFLLLAYSYRGNALRRMLRYAEARQDLDKAERYSRHASPAALAKFYLYNGILRTKEKKPEAFELIGKSIQIYKEGDLVFRHNFGKCLVYRGLAYFEFKQPDKALADFTAAVNHLSPRVEASAYYCALYNLAAFAVHFGSEREVDVAVKNLKEARRCLRVESRYRYERCFMRWLGGVLSFRQLRYTHAQEELKAAAEGFLELKLPFEFASVQLDVVRLLVKQGMRRDAQAAAHETVKSLLELGSDPAAEAAEIWHDCFRGERVTEQRILQTRDRLLERLERFAA